MLAPIVVAFTLVVPAQDSCGSWPVPATPPDSVPAADYNRLFADSNLISLHPRRSDRQPRTVLLVRFRAEATAEQRRAALHVVCGRAIGGWVGYYVVEVNTDGSATALWNAIDRLAAQPGVGSAQPNLPDVVPLKRWLPAPPFKEALCCPPAILR
jgi:hypothetical protein